MPVPAPAVAGFRDATGFTVQWMVIAETNGLAPASCRKLPRRSRMPIVVLLINHGLHIEILIDLASWSFTAIAGQGRDPNRDRHDHGLSSRWTPPMLG